MVAAGAALLIGIELGEQGLYIGLLRRFQADCHG